MSWLSINNFHEVGLIYPARSFMMVVLPPHDRPTRAVFLPPDIFTEKFSNTDD